MGNIFSRDGIFTKMVETLPGGGWITAPIHAAAGNTKHAVQAAVAGYGTMAGSVLAGKPGAIAAKAATAGLSALVSKAIPDDPEDVARTLVARMGSTGVGRIFDEGDLGDNKKREAMRSANEGDSTRAGRLLLEAGQARIAQSTRQLSGEAGGRRTLKSVHGTFLRAIEPDWRVDMVQGPPREWEQWYIEDWGGQVVLKGRGAPNKSGQFLRAHPDGSVDLVGTHPQEWEKWSPLKNTNGSWSFLSIHGTWLSARQDGSVSTVVNCDAWEQFWLEKW